MRSTGARIALLVVLVAVAVGLFVVLSGDDDNGDDNGSTTTSAQTTPGGEPSATTITVKDDMPVGGIQKIEVSKGDTVRLRGVPENVADEVHLHGYDLMQDVAPGQPVTFEFTGDTEGVYEAE